MNKLKTKYLILITMFILSCITITSCSYKTQENNTNESQTDSVVIQESTTQDSIIIIEDDTLSIDI